MMVHSDQLADQRDVTADQQVHLHLLKDEISAMLHINLLGYEYL